MPSWSRWSAVACAVFLAAASGGQASAQQAHRELSRSDFGEPEPASEPESDSDESGAGKLEPWLFIGLASATAVAAGVTLWSGLNTLALNDEYKDYTLQEGALPAVARRDYSDAHSAQTRTNVLIATTSVLAVATLIVGVFFTEWEDPARPPEAKLVPYVDVSERAAGIGFVQAL